MTKKGYKNYIEKPWGYELLIDRIDSINPRITGSTVHKILVVLAGEEISYQYHKYRQEKWTIKSGECKLIINGKVYYFVYPGTVWIIDPLVKHTIIAHKPTVIDEISKNYLESDIIRISDKYGRVK
jgi:mannose-1-phosphate guanylyltransferase